MVGRATPLALAAAGCLIAIAAAGCGRSGANGGHRPGARVAEASSGRCDREATPSSFAAQLSAASGGQTICLANGDYGTWNGTDKAVTIRPKPGASPTMAFDFGRGAANFTLDGDHTELNSASSGINIDGASFFDSGSKNITVENTAATTKGGFFLLDVRTDGPGIVIRGNVFHDLEYPNQTTGAVRVLTPGRVPAGSVVVEDNLFRDMGADGIDLGSPATVIGNEFSNVQSEPGDPRHTDAIQIYGGTNEVIKGNLVHDGCSQGIGAFDGTSGNTIKDNVVVGCTVHSMVLGADKNPGSLVEHNTIVGGAAAAIDCTSKSGEGPSTTALVDNVANSENLGSGDCQPSQNIGNMLASGATAPNFVGTPRFVGGPGPKNFAGFALAPGSPGRGKGPGGQDPGVRPTPPGTAAARSRDSASPA